MTEDLRAAAADAIAHSRALEDPDYPRYHVAPPVGRLNDPNGLLMLGVAEAGASEGEAGSAGIAHAFYQFTPEHPRRKLVYWGHATSRNLLTWERHEPAIIPDSFYDANGAYSGNAVPVPAAQRGATTAGAPYQFFFTGNLKSAEGVRTASQCLLTSEDLTRFTKWPGNPLIPTHAAGYTAHFRDPSVSWDAQSGAWRMILGVQREDLTGATLIYRSADLTSWELDGEIEIVPSPEAETEAGASMPKMRDFGYMWECPGLLHLRDIATGQWWDVLFFCPQGAASPSGDGFENVFPCVYLVGHLRGRRFEDWDGQVREMDRGFEFYAPQAFAPGVGAPVPEGEAWLMGWAGNAGEDQQPSMEYGWVHSLTCVRALSLDAGRLVQRPIALGSRGPVSLGEWARGMAGDVPADAGLARRALGAGGVMDCAELAALAQGRAWFLALDLEGLAAGGSAVEVRLGGQGEFRLRVEGGEQPHLLLDRSATRYVGATATREIRLEAAPARLDVLTDGSLVEVFLDDGALAMTSRAFTAGPGLSLLTEGPARVSRAGSLASAV